MKLALLTALLQAQAASRVVNDAPALASAIADASVENVVVQPGTYVLSAELAITGNKTVRAAVAGSVTLRASPVDAGNSMTGTSMRVIKIDAPGCKVELEGLALTGGALGAAIFPSGGGGLLIINAREVHIISCRITGIARARWAVAGS